MYFILVLAVTNARSGYFRVVSDETSVLHVSTFLLCLRLVFAMCECGADGGYHSISSFKDTSPIELGPHLYNFI